MIDIEKVCTVLKEIQFMMVTDGEKNWIRSINYAVDICDSFWSGQLEEHKALEDLSLIIREIYRGQGTFSDYFLWDEDKAVRTEINERFDKLTSELWNELKL